MYEIANGTRIRLISMNDPYTTLKPGTLGTVHHTDSIGTVHVKWDDGRSLGILPDEGDVIEIIKDGE